MFHEMQAATRKLLRWRLLCIAYESRLTMVSEVLCKNVLAQEFPLSREEVRAELSYLEQSRLLAISGQKQDAWCITLTWEGVDFIEYTSQARDGIARPISSTEPANKRHVRYILRGRLLHMLDVSRSRGMSENFMRETASDPNVEISTDQLRCELRYLAQRELITLNTDSALWFAKITATGTDVFQGTTECPAAIAPRPECARDL